MTHDDRAAPVHDDPVHDDPVHDDPPPGRSTSCPLGGDPGPARLTVRSATDALALVPVVMGFHPEESLVLVTFGGEGFHARVDLPVTEHERREVVAVLVEALRANPCEVVVLVMYGDDEQGCAAVAADLVPALVQQADVAVADVVRADGVCWWSVGADGDDGPGTPYDLTSHPFTADSVLRGRVVRSSRSELADCLVPHDPDAVEAVQEQLSCRGRTGTPSPGPRRRSAAGWLGSTVSGWREAGAPGGAADVARVLVLIADPDLRDVVWGSIHRRDAAEHLALWLQVVRTSPHEWAASPLAVTALCAWLSGDGALAWTAVERAREIDPDHSLAELVAEALGRAVPPSSWRPWDPADLLARHG